MNFSGYRFPENQRNNRMCLYVCNRCGTHDISPCLRGLKKVSLCPVFFNISRQNCRYDRMSEAICSYNPFVAINQNIPIVVILADKNRLKTVPTAEMLSARECTSS